MRNFDLTSVTALTAISKDSGRGATVKGGFLTRFVNG